MSEPRTRKDRDGNKVRVTQLWDPGLRERVAAVVADRGITKFTVAAVEAALGNPNTHEQAVLEAREYAQRVSTALSMMSPADDPQLILSLLKPPAWIQEKDFPWISGAGSAGRLHISPPHISPPHISPPHISPPPEPTPEQQHHDERQDGRRAARTAQVALATATAVTDTGGQAPLPVCPSCSDELIDGQCWSCDWLPEADAHQNTQE